MQFGQGSLGSNGCWGHRLVLKYNTYSKTRSAIIVLQRVMVPRLYPLQQNLGTTIKGLRECCN